ncbi:ABC transporter substrate-binding protein [Thermoleptolyngbya sp. M55_K2018_002]|uniref:ABC transporter substrate-binding protein n=1 Tax=Thermoleptolyngbya sp. M55_K2018_002 TaxID=2747808 RepID=UPI0019E82945|nr:ABC transporter substrate-binding protein [Thermoleptolyngbya sp. M55_K2018_002]HIK40282.1 extracellular solute-binding protein [Thermoleptolyngbya sp. M55_K2018_002]
MSQDPHSKSPLRVSRRSFLGWSAAGFGSAILASCTQSTTTPTASPAASPAGASPAASPAAGGLPLTAAEAGGLEAIIERAKAEGELSVIALPDDWANYKEMKSSFLQKYPFIKLNDLNPDASSADEIEAIKANQGNSGPQNPDVIDVAFKFGEEAKQAGLLQPYKVATWDTIPAALKDPEGFWFGDYYGVMSFEVNTDVVKTLPEDWSDLLKPEYRGQVALAGDPRKSGQAINAVWAAALGNGGSLEDPGPGLEYFKKMNAAGNFLPVIAKPATIAKGETPIALRWDYNALANRDATGGNPEIAVILPKTGLLAGVYVQAINAFAPRPYAARLWMEHLYSDEGQLIWLKGYSRPVRFDDLNKRDVIPADLKAKLPDAAIYEKAAFPTAAQITPANDKITKNWDSVVGADVK